MLVKEADHEVEKVMDDTGELKNFIMLHLQNLESKNPLAHCNFERCVGTEAFSEDELGEFKLE
jgi:hypothetical protein